MTTNIKKKEGKRKMKISKKILASALALAMTVAGTTVAFADETVAMPKGGISNITVDGSTVTVTVSASGDFAAGFDYGIAYDDTKVAVTDYSVSEDFEAFLKKGQGMNTGAVQKDQAYVVLGGVTTNQDKLGNEVPTTYDGVIGSVTFSVNEGVDASSLPFAVVTGSADVAKANAGTKLVATSEGQANTKTPAEFAAPATTAPATTTAPAEETTAPATTTAAATTTAPAENTTVAPTTTATAKTTTAVTKTATAKTTAAATTKTSPKTGDAGVVLPIVAICGAAAAVAVASKKKVED